ncbi:CENP-Q, a CENPA-CAD centromere complex subunit-domain-containing protein [Xylaria venustula]|nr:CENP-Q, a CENPA-CAD centromere complex subunit-domain-containing protein [Xylaria venustula]
MRSKSDHQPAANQKRKRGRRADASRDNEDASSSVVPVASQANPTEMNGETEGGDVDTASRRPKKRGRLAKDHARQEPQPEPSATQRSQSRASSAVPTEHNLAQQIDKSRPSEEMKTTRRGRPRKGGQAAEPSKPEAEEADDENEHEGNSSLLRRSKRHRPSSDQSHASPESRGAQGEEAGPLASQQATKKRKRPNRSKDTQQQEEEASRGDKVETSARAKKEGRGKVRRSQDAQASMAEGESNLKQVLPRKNRGRPLRSEGDDRKSGTGPRSQSADAQRTQHRPAATRRKLNARGQPSEGHDQSPDRSSSPASVSSPPYRHIAKRTRRVTHNVIESKWSSLDSSSLTNIASLLHSVSLPTLHHVVPKQHAHAEEVLQKVIKGLRKRSARLPFPLASALPRREDELDFEKTQSAVEGLVSQLDPLQHSVELLKREKERAEKELEREYKILDQLSTNARAEARERRNRLKKVHVLVPETTYNSNASNINVFNPDKAASSVFAGIRDEEILTLAGQINSHMESMQGNLQQIDGVLPAIAKSHAMLRNTLQPQLSQKHLENIMLG